MRRRTLFLTLAVLLTLTGCTKPVPPAEEPEPDPQPIAVQPSPQQPAREPDDMFSLPYAPEDSLNPFRCENLYNEQLLGLCYEGLFVLDSELVPEPCLCESFETADGVTYTLRLRQDVLFHDGTPLEANDVVHSLNAARKSDKFASRLDCIESVSAAEDGSVTVTLRYANYRLPALLDTPIVQDGSANSEFPTGTGPYELDYDRLRAFHSYRTYSPNTPPVIYLTERSPSKLVEAFLSRDVDLLCGDPTGTVSLNVYAVHETRSFATTDLLYLGINVRRGVTADPDFRRALSFLVDREDICSDIFGGLVEEAPLILHPKLTVYDESWAEETGYSRQTFLESAAFLGLVDTDADGVLEYDGNISLRLIVNEDNPRKVEAARRIATDFTDMGVRTELAVLTWDDYLTALAAGDFDLYLGETRLKADFDLTALLDPAGPLNFGGVSEDEYTLLTRDYQGALTEAELTSAAKLLCYYVRTQAPVIPIAYKGAQLITRVGDIAGGAPSQSNIFRDVTSWTFNGFQ